MAHGSRHAQTTQTGVWAQQPWPWSLHLSAGSSLDNRDADNLWHPLFNRHHPSPSLSPQQGSPKVQALWEVWGPLLSQGKPHTGLLGGRGVSRQCWVPGTTESQTGTGWPAIHLCGALSQLEEKGWSQYAGAPHLAMVLVSAVLSPSPANEVGTEGVGRTLP